MLIMDKIKLFKNKFLKDKRGDFIKYFPLKNFSNINKNFKMIISKINMIGMDKLGIMNKK